ncbi:unnamed protein product [Oppiella nova]|uniref:TEA domain-containing protein n=1 Tax=Oppiella nova TaxID=334625 RepID=A0A7R9M479_9ACAR|nr:unnamed protein product [Oppiella nova]CAG2169944.1 unnamed protein product [Oppiella nova]
MPITPTQLTTVGLGYGRNELIARYIKLRTGKTRTRKQVSSHIQVLARRKAREIQSKMKVSTHKPNEHMIALSAKHDSGHKEAALQSMSSLSGMSSAQIVSLFYSSQDQSVKEKALQSLTASQIAALQNKAAAHHVHHAATHVAAAAAGLATLGLTAPPVTPYTPSPFWQPAGPTNNEDIKPFNAPTGGQYVNNSNNNLNSGPAWEGRAIATHKLRLVEFSAFMERHDNDSDKHLFVHIGIISPVYSDPLLESVDIRQIYDKFPEKKGGLKELYDKGPQNAFFLVKFWADLNTSLLDESGAFYGVTSHYESNENMTITCSTKVCSFGKQVVEKVETEYARFENGRFVYRIHRSPMCEYMINFIHKLKNLPEKYMMNSVLENFTILQVVTNRETQETLLCIAYVFEVSETTGTQHHIYRLMKD